MTTSTEENYLKAIFSLSLDRGDKDLGTNEIAEHLKIAPPTASSMLKKLKEKELISYEKYGGISLKPLGTEVATLIIRKHRLWETFLYEKMDFSWDEIHEVAEQLEHINSKKLTDQLDKLLGYPEYDPHGDPIPNANGEYREGFKQTLLNTEVGKSYRIMAVSDISSEFLQYASEIGIAIDTQIIVKAKQAFDDSMEIEINSVAKMISSKVAENIFVKLV